jgi:hypothetical protein
MLEIFIEGKKLDVNEEFSMLMTYAIDDIKDFGARNTTFSKTVILPGTNNNNLLFGNIFDASVSNDYDPNSKNVGINFNASVSAGCVVFNNNLQVVKGVMQMLEIVIDDGFVEYEVGIFGELTGFTSALGASLLSGNLNEDGTADTTLDLDFSAYNQSYTLANIVASWVNIGSGSGIVYPLIDYGTYGRNAGLSAAGKHSWQYLTFRPALHIKEYIEKIFARVGYTYDCALFNTARFKGLVMPHNAKQLTRTGSDILTMNAPYQLYNNANPGTTLVVFSDLITLYNFTTTDNQTFTYSGTDGFKGNISANLSIQYTGAGSVVFNLYKNSTVIATASYTAGTHVFTLTSVSSLVAGDYIEVEYVLLPSRTLVINTGKLTAAGGDKQNIPVYRNRDLIINDCIPSNILQKDFISSICKMFNLYLYEDPNKDKHLQIAPYVDFFNLSTSIDWSYKLDRSKPIKIKPMSELTARYYLYEYKKDSDYWNDLYNKRYNITYGSYKLDTKYQLSQDSRKVEIIFSGTPIVGYQGEDKVYSSIFKRTGTDAAPVEETTDSNIRILQTKLVSGVSSWSILDSDGTTVLGTYTNYPYAGHFDDPDTPSNDIGFGVPQELFFTLLAGSINVNQFNVYWSSYLAELTDKDAKLLTGTFKLNLRDINTLDFSKYIYLDGSLWRINQIIDFNATKEDTCTVELIKLINKLY